MFSLAYLGKLHRHTVPSCSIDRYMEFLQIVLSGARFFHIFSLLCHTLQSTFHSSTRPIDNQLKVDFDLFEKCLLNEIFELTNSNDCLKFFITWTFLNVTAFTFKHSVFFFTLITPMLILYLYCSKFVSRSLSTWLWAFSILPLIPFTMNYCRKLFQKYKVHRIL